MAGEAVPCGAADAPRRVPALIAQVPGAERRGPGTSAEREIVPGPGAACRGVLSWASGRWRSSATRAWSWPAAATSPVRRAGAVQKQEPGRARNEHVESWWRPRSCRARSLVAQVTLHVGRGNGRLAQGAVWCGGFPGDKVVLNHRRPVWWGGDGGARGRVRQRHDVQEVAHQCTSVAWLQCFFRCCGHFRVDCAVQDRLAWLVLLSLGDVKGVRTGRRSAQPGRVVSW